MDTSGVSKALTFLLTVIGLGIFYIVIMTKLEVMAQQTQASIQKYSADLAWENYLYDQTVLNTAQQRSSRSSITEPAGTQYNMDQ